MSNKKIVFIDNTSHHTHNTIKNTGIGASEYQFYNLVEQFSRISNGKIKCFNRSIDIELNNVIYKNYDLLMETSFDYNSIFVIQRFFPYEENIRNKLYNYKTYLWIHDIPYIYIFVGNNTNMVDYYEKNLDIFKNYLRENFVLKNIHFVFNSHHCKNMFIEYLQSLGLSIEDNRLIVIYNILYEDEFKSVKNKPTTILKNQLVFASAWQKGIEDVISIFEYIVQIDNSYILILMHPGYGMERFNDYKIYLLDKFPNNIIIKDSLSKDKYGEIIKESLCVLSSRFNETFGCIFAESYYLGTPVIASNESGAVKEIIDNNFIVDYNNKEQIYNMISELSFKRDYINIKLEDKFLFKENFNKWKSILL